MHPNPLVRLSAKTAIHLPAFNKIRQQAKVIEEAPDYMENEDEMIESNEPVNSIKSLEIRSAMMRNANGSNSDANSVGSIRLEGDQPAEPKA